MGKKKDAKQLKARFERDFDRLRDELGGLQKQALKQVKRLEDEVSGLRNEVLRLAARPFDGGKPSTAGKSGKKSADKPKAVAAKANKKADKPKSAKPKAKSGKTATVAELRKQAKAQGVKGYSTMKKAELLAAVK